MTEGMRTIQSVEGQEPLSWSREDIGFSGHGFRFGAFELDSKTGELRRDGRLIHLRNQPFQALCVLLERVGDLVTREEMKAVLWADNVDVDVEQGLNYCIKEIRAVLGDSAESPRFIQTLPRRGYRFLADVRRYGNTPASPAPVTEETPPPALPPGRTARVTRWTGSIALLAALAAGAAVYRYRSEPLYSSTTSPIRLVVLPFTDLSPAPEGYLADGLTDELIGALSRKTGNRVGVIARSSSLAYRERPHDPGAFARELGASHFIEGTVRREARDVRVNVSLARADDGLRLWAATYQRDIDDLLSLERELAKAIGSEVRVAFVAEPGSGAPVDSAAYLQYLRGRYEWNKRSRESLFESLRIFEALTRSSPEFALGWAGLADAYSVLMDHGYVSPRDGWMRARAAAEKAVTLDPNMAEAWTNLAMIRGLYEWNPRASAEAFDRAAAINPNYTTLLNWRSILLRSEGRFAEAHADLLKARSLDPLSLGIRVNMAAVLIELDRASAAVAEAERIVTVAPQWGPGLIVLGEALMAAKRPDQAEAAFRSAERVGAPAAKATLAWFHAVKGNKDQAAEKLAELERSARTSYVSPYLVAMASAAIDHERAFQALEVAFEERSPALRLLQADPRFASLRGDPRFARLVKILRPADDSAPRAVRAGL
jgi:TolB-like protein/DNA-binding winged helix-turn-helix (wHTH) protein/Tfp pilus assembly protein PilF